MPGDFLLSLRREERGGKQRDEILEVKPPAPGLIWLMFIHGFHVSQNEALHQWRTLRSRLRTDGQVQAGALLWPSGDSRFSYPKIIRSAKIAGRKLGDYLFAHPASSAVLLGHSLGALVALSAADWVQRRGGQLHGLVLLGAAVGVSELEGYGDYGLFPLAKSEAIGFSPADRTLQIVFVPGQFLAAPFVPREEAVGLNGRPETRGWERRDSKSSDHSYWKLQVSADLARWALGPASLSWRPEEHRSAERLPEEHAIA